MTFTDDDLERLQFSLGTLYVPTINPKVLEALLARLELAEKCIGVASHALKYTTELEAWRKAAGK